MTARPWWRQGEVPYRRKRQGRRLGLCVVTAPGPGARDEEAGAPSRGVSRKDSPGC